MTIEMTPAIYKALEVIADDILSNDFPNFEVDDSEMDETTGAVTYFDENGGFIIVHADGTTTEGHTEGTLFE